MQETLILFVFFLLAVLYGAPIQTNDNVPNDGIKHVGTVENLVLPDSLFDSHIVKGYYPEVVQHIRRKRQTEKPAAENKTSSKKIRRKNRRRQKQVLSNEDPNGSLTVGNLRSMKITAVNMVAKIVNADNIIADNVVVTSGGNW